MSDTIKNRSIKLDSEHTADDANSLYRRLQETGGIVDVTWMKPDRLKVKYELMDISLAQIEQKLEEFGSQIENELLNRLIRGWIHFLEENEMQNLRSVPRSCCSVPDSKH